MNTITVNTSTLKEIVTQDFQTAAVFEKFSLDFCCRGGKTIEQACREKGISPETVMQELSLLRPEQTSAEERFSGMGTEDLIEYITRHHHAYVRTMIPILYTHTQKVAAVHGANHPVVIAIARHFETVAAELQQHMAKEEQMLFPFILKLSEAKRQGKTLDRAPFGSVQNPIRMTESEHQNAGDELYEIRSLSNGYTPPEDACTTFCVTYQELQSFEKDLHQHVHLENNILFPRAVALEHELISSL
ncbi:MAG: iron-sulfur cluster repair di-iron protein [Bacteroidota bacterium]